MYENIPNIVDIKIGSYLDCKEFNKLIMLNKNLYEKKDLSLWNAYFHEKYNKQVSFQLSGKDVYEWEMKNMYEENQILYFPKRKLELFKKKRIKSFIPILDFFFPKYQCLKTKDYQIYVDKNNRISKWNGYYFEIHFPLMICYESVQIGFCEDNLQEQKLPLIGWNKNSIGFHMDDSQLYYYYDQKLNMRRVSSLNQKTFFIGAGIDFDKNEFFFTVNGCNVISIKNPYKTIQYWRPIFSSEHKKVPFLFNDGKFPFHYDLKN